jgi:pheromone shutdown protein TraB
VFVELDEKRGRRIMTQQKATSFTDTLFEQLKRDQPLLTSMLGASLKTIQNIFHRFGLESGAEFKVAMEEAQRINATLVYGDRCGDETLRRLTDATLRTMPELLPKLMGADGGDLYRTLGKYSSPGGMSMGMGGLADLDPAHLERTIENLKNRVEIRHNNRILNRVIPRIMNAMLHERDQIMVDNLKRLPQDARIVAVCGMAHMDGIERRFMVRSDQRKLPPTAIAPESSSGEPSAPDSTPEPPRFVM